MHICITPKGRGEKHSKEKKRIMSHVCTICPTIFCVIVCTVRFCPHRFLSFCWCFCFSFIVHRESHIFDRTALQWHDLKSDVARYKLVSSSHTQTEGTTKHMGNPPQTWLKYLLLLYAYCTTCLLLIQQREFSVNPQSETPWIPGAHTGEANCPN